MNAPYRHHSPYFVLVSKLMIMVETWSPIGTQVTFGPMSIDFEAHRMRFMNSRHISASFRSTRVDEPVLAAAVSIDSQKLRVEWPTVTLTIQRNTSLTSDTEIDVYDVSWTTNSLHTLTQAFTMGSSNGVHWYGGAEMLKIEWPLEKNRVGMFPYIAYDPWTVRELLQAASSLQYCGNTHTLARFMPVFKLISAISRNSNATQVLLSSSSTQVLLLKTLQSRNTNLEFTMMLLFGKLKSFRVTMDQCRNDTGSVRTV